jgi:hypothetical protein
MTNPSPSQEQPNLAEYAEIGQKRYQLLLQRNELINKMLASQNEFMKALEENARADAKLVAK